MNIHIGFVKVRNGVRRFNVKDYGGRTQHSGGIIYLKCCAIRASSSYYLSTDVLNTLATAATKP